MMQQLQQKAHNNPEQGFFFTPPSLSFRSVHEFTTHSVQHGKSDISMQPDQ
jgi:hypothetical protein